MSTIIKVSSNTITSGILIRYEVSGGTAPYVVTLVAGGDGGTLLPNGYYQAPNAIPIGEQKIKAVDALLQEFIITIYLVSYPQLVCKIIQDYMGLSNGQVFLYNQKITLPKDSNLYIALKVDGVKTFGSSVKYDGTNEISSVNAQANLSIDIMSRSLLALTRKEELIFALNSFLSQRIQAANSFKIASIPSSMTDISNIEGSLIPYRFNVSINVLYAKSYRASTDYYDDFSNSIIINE